jgi:hypothetical protein
MSRELDREVAEKVMGLTIDPLVESEWTYCFWSDGKRLPLYSSNIAAAWLVVEKMRERGCYFRYDDSNGPWALFGVEVWTRFWTAEADTAPEAICRAALSAVKAKEEDNATD